MIKRTFTHFHTCCGFGSGAAFMLSNVSIWVQPADIALSVPVQEVQQ